MFLERFIEDSRQDKWFLLNMIASLDSLNLDSTYFQLLEDASSNRKGSQFKLVISFKTS